MFGVSSNELPIDNYYPVFYCVWEREIMGRINLKNSMNLSYKSIDQNVSNETSKQNEEKYFSLYLSELNDLMSHRVKKIYF